MKILIDTNEKQPWLFAAYDVETALKNMNTGDYTIEGMEKLLCIERKASVAEVASNITKPRFINELERMCDFQYRYLILEFDYRHIDDFPEGAGIPSYLKNKIKVKSPFIIKSLSKIMTKYNIHIIPCSNRIYAEHVAYSIMKETYECYRKS